MATKLFEPDKTADKVVLCLVLLAVGGIAGGFLGGEIGRATVDPDEYLSGLDVLGAQILGVALGAIVAPLAGLVWLEIRHPPPAEADSPGSGSDNAGLEP